MNKYILAAAGSGKTSHIVKAALNIMNSRILITTLTDANKDEIVKKICELNHGIVPKNIIVKAWFTFLLHDGVKPYQDIICDIKVSGVELVNKKSGYHYTYNGIPVYYSETSPREHYFSSQNKIYSDKISKFVDRVDSATYGSILERLEKIYDYIFIDEVQDLAGYDLELLKKLFNSSINIVLVGDPRQVTFHTHNEAKYKKYSNGNIDEFLAIECKKENVLIDTTSLNNSYRNNQIICDFAYKIYPNFSKCDSNTSEVTGHDGIFFVREKDAVEYLKKYKPVQLRNSKASKCVLDGYQIVNFGDCKGLTFDRVAIIPTSPFLGWIKDHNSKLNDESRAKLYVAVTRAKYSVAFIVPNDFDVPENNSDGIHYYK